MGLWSAYFLAKLLLFAGGYIDFDVWLNLSFALFTALPPQNARQRFARNLLAVPLSILLLYHDSWLPPVARLMSQTTNLASFSVPYLAELAGRFVSGKVLLELGVFLVVYALARRKLRLSTFVFMAIFAVMLFPDGLHLMQPGVAAPAADAAGRPVTQEVDARNLPPEVLDKQLQDFYAAESSRRVRFSAQSADAVPYDILILQVCSLSRDDLETVKRSADPFFKRFDILMSRFNSAASYSGPAAVRLLRGNCGQTAHGQLYDAPDRECLVIDALQAAGFEPRWLMNHDGHFGDFVGAIRKEGGMTVSPEDIRGAQVALRAFDDSPIYDDYSVLSQWWTRRLASPAKRVALYYNTTSLHDGNHLPGGAVAPFADRLTRLLDDMGRFMDDVRNSGRRAIVVFVPEHGAAVLGDRRQIQGLREIPTPAITQVPVGIALVDGSRQATAHQDIDAPTSYLALNELLSRMQADDPFGSSAAPTRYLQNLPETQAVAENEGTVVMQVGKQYMLRTPDGEWSGWDTKR